MFFLSHSAGRADAPDWWIVTDPLTGGQVESLLRYGRRVLLVSTDPHDLFIAEVEQCAPSSHRSDRWLVKYVDPDDGNVWRFDHLLKPDGVVGVSAA